MRNLLVYSVVAASLGSFGCGTLLALGQAPVTDVAPEGVVVNRRATYAVSFSIPTGSPLANAVRPDAAPSTLRGVDHDYLLTLDVVRMPFSSGKLVVELDAHQLLKKVGLTSRTGAVRAAEAAERALDARTELERLGREAAASAGD